MVTANSRQFEPVESHSDGCYVWAHPVVEMLRNGDFRHLAPRLVAAALVLFAILYVLVISNPPPADGSFGDWRTTTYGSAFDDPGLVHR